MSKIQSQEDIREDVEINTIDEDLANIRDIREDVEINTIDEDLANFCNIHIYS